MLYLRTGGNGSGKTLLTLQEVRKLQLETGRPVYFNVRPGTDPAKPGKPYCNLKPEIIERFGWKPFSFKDWESCEDNAIFLVDECHYDIPTRSGRDAPPPHIQRLTEHRSRGFDFFLLTQHPKNIDTFVRNLVQAPGWHEHIKRLGGALPVAQCHKWDAVNLNCERFGSAKDAQSKTRPYPKEVYGWYESATIHTGKTRVPWQVWVILFVPFLVVFFMWRGINFIGKPSDSSSAKSSVEASASAAPSASGAAPNAPMSALQYAQSHMPRVEGLAHSAPRFDALTVPTRVPVPVACISAKGRCKCYTQDATVYQTTLAICQQIVQNGLWLDFSPAGQHAQAQPLSTVSQPVAPQVQQQGPALVVMRTTDVRGKGVASEAP